MSDSVISYQTDIVIYDASHGIAIPIDDYYSLFPCECVYAAIEVKSELNASDGEKGPGGTINECIEGTTRLKLLNRAAHSLSPIHSIVFAYTTAWENGPAEHLKRWFETLGEKYKRNLPEVVFVLEPGFVLGTYGSSGYNEHNKFTNIYNTETLLYFTSDLLHRLTNTATATPNLWSEYIDWQPEQIMAKIYSE